MNVYKVSWTRKTGHKENHIIVALDPETAVRMARVFLDDDYGLDGYRITNVEELHSGVLVQGV